MSRSLMTEHMAYDPEDENENTSLAFPASAHLRGSALGIRPHHEHFHGAVLLHGQGQGEVAERIEGHGHLGALRAD